MRVLIADRNGRLLEAIARTFADRFAIQTASTHEQCNELLRLSAFDLVVISEKLADGLGLQLLGQIARDTPDTLRVFAARRSRLQLLKGKLGPFGLFRTLSYPVDPQELLSVLTLARAGLEIHVPAQTRDIPVVEPHKGEVAAAHADAGLAPLARSASASTPASEAAVQPAVERISFTSADAAFAIDVPKLIKSIKRRRPKSVSVTPPATAPATPPATGVAPKTTATPPTSRSAPASARAPASVPESAPVLAAARAPASTSPSAVAPAITPASAVAPPTTPASARAQHTFRSSTSSQAAAASAIAPPRFSPPRTTRQHRPARHEAAERSPLRTKLVLGATIAAVFLATTLTLNFLDGGVHVTRASTPVAEIMRPAIYTPPAPAGLAPMFRPTPRVAQRVEPKPVAPEPDVDPTDPQVAAAATAPVADPSTFGSEAYEPIYAN